MLSDLLILTTFYELAVCFSLSKSKQTVTMMTIANYAIGSNKQKDRNVDKILSKSLQIRNRAEHALKQNLKAHYRLTDEKRQDILNQVRDYYSRIPLDSLIWNKYQTKQCIIDSILLLDTRFNPYKAREAFKLVEKMLINLVYLPWHSEFRKIHLYSGLFRMAVSEPLIGIEEVFKAAGFVTSPATTMHLYLPDNKMPQVDDGESVTSVIFDTILAQAVCSDMINVFESSCKAAKSTIEGSHIYDSLSHSWLQAFLSERCQETTERASTKLQDLLRDLTNHISRISSSKYQQQVDKHILDDCLKSSQATRSFKSDAHERTREFLLQQSHEDEGTVMLSHDLLRLPSSGDLTRRTANLEAEQSSSNRHKLNMRPVTRDVREVQQQHMETFKDSTSGIVYQKRSAFDRNAARHSAHSEPGRCNYNQHEAGGLDTADAVYPLHSDREPLLPKYERRPVSAYNQIPSRKVTSVYDNNYDSNSALLDNGSTHSRNTNRHQYNSTASSYYNENSSQSQATSGNQTKGLSSKYNNMQYTKYTEREPEKPSSSSRLQWSCGSCTYNNQVNSEICEMCRRSRS